MFVLHLRGVYLCLLFEMSIWEFITNSQKIDFKTNLIFFVEFELDFYCLCSLQKSISKSNWFFKFFKLDISKLKKNRVTHDISKIKWRYTGGERIKQFSPLWLTWVGLNLYDFQLNYLLCLRSINLKNSLCWFHLFFNLIYFFLI